MTKITNTRTERLENYTLKFEDSLKNTGKCAVYHWRTDEDDREELIKVFFELSNAKHYFEIHKNKIMDVSALEIYLMDSSIRDEYDSITSSIKVHQDLLKLVKSIDMPFAEDKVNFFGDILPKEKAVNYGDEFDCFMEKLGRNEEYLLRSQEVLAQ